MSNAKPSPPAGAQRRNPVSRLRYALFERRRLSRYIRENWTDLIDASAGRAGHNAVEQFHRLPVTDMPCPICGTDGISHAAVYPSNRAPFRDWVAYFCAGCGAGFVPDSHRLLGDYYAANYAKDYAPDRLEPPETYFKGTNTPAHLRRVRRAESQLSALKKSNARLDRVLDYGSGAGLFLHLCKPKEAFAIEADAAAHKHLDYLGATRITPTNLEKMSFDVILASHVLEHFPAFDLLPTVRQMLAALAPGGQLLIEVPQAGHSYLRLDSPNDPHAVFFSAQGLFALIERAGGEVVTSFARVKREAPLRDDPIYVPHEADSFFRTRGGGLTVIAKGPRG